MTMKVRALRGVCIGVERHLKPDEVADLDAAMGNYLIGIGAVEPFIEPPAPAVQPTAKPPEQSGKKEK